MTSNKIEDLDYYIRKFYMYCNGKGDFDELDLKGALNDYYLELVLEIIGDIEQRETEDMSLLSWTPEDYKVFGKNELKIELRNALNQRLGEGKLDGTQ